MSGLTDRVRKALVEPHAIQRGIARAAFPILEKCGFHLVGDHFYEPIPNSRLIAHTYPTKGRDYPPVTRAMKGARVTLEEMISLYAPEFAHRMFGGDYRERNSYFDGLDAITLYSVIRHFRPRRLVEIGQGFSTLVILQALQANAADSTDSVAFASVDPFDRLRLDDQSFPFDTQLIRAGVQDVERSVFDLLEAGDLLFIDSTHVLKYGSDVRYEFDELIPAVKPGVMIHLHDIFTPFEYPRDWLLKHRRFWTEQYLLEAFMRFNSAFEIVFPVHALAQTPEFAARVRSLCQYPGFEPSGSSFYITRSGEHDTTNREAP